MLTCQVPKGFAAAAKALKAVMGRLSSAQRMIRVEATAGAMTLTTTNAEQTLTVTLPVEGDQDAVLIPCEAFLKAIRDAKRFTLTEGAVQTEVGTFALAFEGDTDFPAQAHACADGTSMNLPREVLDYGFSGISQDETKPALSAMLLDFSHKGLIRLVSTDGFRMAVAETSRSAKAPLGSRLICPPKAVIVLRDLPLGDIQVFDEKRTMTFRGEGWALTTRLVQGSYPAYERVLPDLDRLNLTYTFDRVEFLDAVRKASKAADLYNRNLRLYLADDRAGLEFIHPDGPMGTAIVSLKTKANPMDLAFNHLYLEDLTRYAQGKRLSYLCRDDNGLGAFQGDAKGPWTMRTYVMPVKFAGQPGEAGTAEAIRAKVEQIALAQVGPETGHTCRGDLKALDRLVGVTVGKSKAHLPILKKVRLEGTNGALRASMTLGMELFLTLDLPGRGEHPAVLVDGAALRGGLKGADRLSLKDGACMAGALMMPTIAAEDYPAFPEIHGGAGAPAVSLALSKAALVFGASAMSQDGCKPAMSNLLLDLEEDQQARIVSSDGFRLAVVGLPVAPATKGSFILPHSAVPVLNALIDDGQPVDVFTSEEHVTFRGRSWTLTARTVNANFPKYRKVMPTPAMCPSTFKVMDRGAFRKALAVIAAKADDYNDKLTLDAQGTTGRLSLNHPDSGLALAEFACEVEGEAPAGLEFNVRFLRDLAEKVQAPEMAFRWAPAATWMLQEDLGVGMGQAFLMPKYPGAPRVEAAAEVRPEPAAEEPEPVAAGPAPEPESEPVVAEPEPEVVVVEVVEVEAPAETDAHVPGAIPAVRQLMDGQPEGTLPVWRQDAKAVRALGGREGIKAAKFKVKWEIRQSKGFVNHLPLCWYVPVEVLADLGIIPITEDEARAIFRERSAKGKAVYAGPG